MSKFIISDGVALLKLSPMSRYLLNRPHLVFEVDRISTLYVENRPKRRALGTRKSPNPLKLFRVGEYLLGVKRILVIGSRSKLCLRILVMNPHFDEILLTGREVESTYIYTAGQIRKNCPGSHQKLIIHSQISNW